MLHFEDPRLEPDTDPESPIVFIEKKGKKEETVPRGTAIMIIIMLLMIIGLFYLIYLTGGAILAA